MIIIYPILGKTLILNYQKDDLEKRDKWQSLLMPSGAIVAARVDTSHWETFGTENTMPVLY